MLSLFILAGCSADYHNSALSPERRAKALLKQMTLEEKVGQTLCPVGFDMFERDGDSVRFNDEYRKFVGEMHGGMMWATFRADPWSRKTLENGLNPTLEARLYNMMQHYAVDSTRLGIPVILAEEAPHGHMAIGSTVFPTAIAMASTWDTDLMERTGRAVARELRAVGGHIGYGPVIDLAREPRWSRVEEDFGEDVCLASEMASALVRGESPLHNGWDRGVVATLKHFVAYGIPEGGHNGGQAVVGERELRENFLPQFKAAIDAGALSVMTSYNSIDGVPTSGNPLLLRGVLRDEWGFDGFVVSDLHSVVGLVGTHHVAADPLEAGVQALEAGVDVDLGIRSFSMLAEAVRDGRVSEKVLDEAVLRVLKIKFELGLFDNPYLDESVPAGEVRSAENVALSRQVAREGITLLENNGILPLDKSMRIAVIGPNADTPYNQLGDYTATQDPDLIVTPLRGIRNAVEGAGTDGGRGTAHIGGRAAGRGRVTYAKGCAVRDTKQTDIAAAVRAAREADVAVVVVGGSSARDFRTSYAETGAAQAGWSSATDMECGEGYDRSTLTLLGDQQKLLEAVKATGKPMVVVYIEGRPLDKRWAAENADALLTQWYCGQEGGNALADVLFGDYNPAGRLPVSVPREVGQLPVYYNRKAPLGSDYVETSARPLYPFGYGLSYTSFEYSDLQVKVEGHNVGVSLTVKNVGKTDGDEVVQLYVSDPVASVVRPMKQLRAFRRVFIPAGESVRVEFSLGEDAFALYDRQMKRVVEPGDFFIGVGASSEDLRLRENITLD